MVISGDAPELPVPVPPFDPPQPHSSARTRTARAAVRRPRVISGGYGRTVARRLARRGTGGEREAERAASAGRALRPDPAAVVLDDPLAHREPDPGSRVGALAVQAVEGLEDLLRLALLHADPVVAHGEPPG